jgi:hypothetical protein
VVEHNTVTKYVATVRGHEVRVDQPLAAGGTVHAEYRKADRPPARIASIQLRVIVPAGLPTGTVKPLHAVVSHCTVHNTLREPPTVDIQIDGESMPD